MKTIELDPKDNVLVALSDLYGTVEHCNEVFQLHNLIPQKHKFFRSSLRKGDIVTMYGVPVAKTTVDVNEGERLSSSNVEHFAAAMDLRKKEEVKWKPTNIDKWNDRTFEGYWRKDGSVGTANYWLFIPLVFCENRNLRVIEATLNEALGYAKPNDYLSFTESLLGKEGLKQPKARERVFKNIDGIKFLYHDGGCGGTKEDSEALLRLLVSYLNHPNVAGATVLSLGCQHAQVDWFKHINRKLYPDSSRPVLFFEQQQVSSEEELIKESIRQTIEALQTVDENCERRPAPLSKLTIGLECGGSDGFSGISANPAVGHLSDLVVSLGGSTILSEFPELNGVEQEILNRAASQQVAERFYEIQTAYEKSAKAVGSGFEMNPSPGNIKDGLITDAMKSAGAAKKGGKAPITDVLDYTEHVTSPGLNLLCTPGNDVESTTGLAGAGANLIVFTTGLGTPTGNPVAPVIKVASNTHLFEKMPDIIDFNAGEIISGEKSIEQVGEELLEKVIQVASGEETKATQLDQNDFIFWKRGVSL